VDEIFKETAKRSPVITLTFVTVIYLFSKLIEKEIPIWQLVIIALSTLTITSLVIYFHYKNKQEKDVKISNLDISEIKTKGGDFTIGSKDADVHNLLVEKAKIKDVSTDGGEFFIGKKHD
jgi:hypothetical protein